MQQKIKFHRRLGGSLIAFVVVVLLAALGWFFWQKYTAPIALARLLPADSTLFFAELKTDAIDREFQQLRTTFAETSASELFDLAALGFAQSERLLDLIDRRAGVAFLGDRLDPRRFVLVLNTPNRDVTFEFLESQTLPGEQLVETTYLGQKIWSYPRSTGLTFTFDDDDLLLATDRTDLQAIIEVRRANAASVHDSASYRAVLSKLNPRATGFAYFSGSFIQEVLTARAGGSNRLLIAPLLDLWSGGGFTLSVHEEDIVLTTHLALKNAATRRNLFRITPPLDPALLDLLGAEVQQFWAVNEASAQLAHFLNAIEKFNPELRVLLAGTINKITREWLGDEITFGEDIAPLFDGASIVGFTRTGGLVGILQHPEIAAKFEQLKTKVLASGGRLVAREKTVVLPDGTIIRELVSDPDAVLIDNEFLAGIRVNRLRFPHAEFNYTLRDDLLFFATEQSTIAAVLNRFVESKKSGIVTLSDALQTPTSSLNYQRLSKSKPPFLEPFFYALTGIDFAPDGISLEIILGQ